jgi:hypothetical protein
MRGDPEFDAIWAAWFAEHPEVLASWRHQNGYLPADYEDNPYVTGSLFSHEEESDRGLG